METKNGFEIKVYEKDVNKDTAESKDWYDYCIKNLRQAGENKFYKVYHGDIIEVLNGTNALNKDKECAEDNESNLVYIFIVIVLNASDGDNNNPFSFSLECRYQKNSKPNPKPKLSKKKIDIEVFKKSEENIFLIASIEKNFKCKDIIGELLSIFFTPYEQKALDEISPEQAESDNAIVIIASNEIEAEKQAVRDSGYK